MTSLRTVGAALATVVAASAATMVGAGPASASGNDTWPVPTSASIVVSGHGYGHGHGMSQYGAEGAARQGLSWKQIVGFYYPGTRLGHSGGMIRVLITENTTKSVIVDAQRLLALHRLQKPKRGPSTWRLDQVRPAATTWRIKAHHRQSEIDYRLPGTSKQWHRWTSFPGEAEFTAGGLPMTLHLPNKVTTDYRGVLRLADKQTVNIVSLDRYLLGVVPSEAIPSWPQQALRAQAVAARTYAAYERRNPASESYDICDTAVCQVYGGASIEQPSTSKAVHQTAGRVLDYQGAPAFSQFSSSNGGWTSAGSVPYLIAQPDPYEASSDNPNGSWSVAVSDQDIEKAFPQVGDLTEISFEDRDGNGEWGGRVGSVVLTGSAGSTVVTGDDFRSALALKSTWMTVTNVSATNVAARHLAYWMHHILG